MHCLYVSMCSWRPGILNEGYPHEASHCIESNLVPVQLGHADRWFIGFVSIQYVARHGAICSSCCWIFFGQLLQVYNAEQGQMRMRLLFMGIWQHCISSSSSSYTWKAVHNQQLPLPMLWMILILVMGFKLFAHLIPAMGAQSTHDCPWRFLT